MLNYVKTTWEALTQMYKLPWPVPHLFPVCQNFLSDCLSYFLCCEKGTMPTTTYKRKHLVGILFAVAEVEPMAIMVENMAADR